MIIVFILKYITPIINGVISLMVGVNLYGRCIVLLKLTFRLDHLTVIFLYMMSIAYLSSVDEAASFPSILKISLAKDAILCAKRRSLRLSLLLCTKILTCLKSVQYYSKASETNPSK